MVIIIHTTIPEGQGKTLMQLRLAEALEAAGFPITISDYNGPSWDAVGCIEKAGERALKEADQMNRVPVHIHVSSEVKPLDPAPMPRIFRSPGLRTPVNRSLWKYGGCWIFALIIYAILLWGISWQIGGTLWTVLVSHGVVSFLGGVLYGVGAFDGDP